MFAKERLSYRDVGIIHEEFCAHAVRLVCEDASIVNLHRLERNPDPEMSELTAYS